MSEALSLNPDLEIQLEDLFSGPFDLLLHLVRKHELDLREIPLGFLAERYLEALRRLRELNIDIATDFLVIAATLVQWKSRVVLPSSSPEEQEEEDPAALFAQRLALYRLYRKGAAWLFQRTQQKRWIWRRGAPLLLKEEHAEPLEPIPLELLPATFQDLLPKEGTNRYGRSSMATGLSLQERVAQLMELLDAEQSLSFSRLLAQDPDQGVRQRVLTFLAVLELSRLGLTTLVGGEEGRDFILLRCTQDDQPHGEAP